MLDRLFRLFLPSRPTTWEPGCPFPNGCVPLHNFAPQPKQTPLYNVPREPRQVPLHNFYHGN